MAGHKFKNVDTGDGITTPICTECGCHAYHEKAKHPCSPRKPGVCPGCGNQLSSADGWYLCESCEL